MLSKLCGAAGGAAAARGRAMAARSAPLVGRAAGIAPKAARSGVSATASCVDARFMSAAGGAGESKTSAGAGGHALKWAAGGLAGALLAGALIAAPADAKAKKPKEEMNVPPPMEGIDQGCRMGDAPFEIVERTQAMRNQKPRYVLGSPVFAGSAMPVALCRTSLEGTRSAPMASAPCAGLALGRAYL